MSKQSDADRAAITGTGASPLRPNITCSRSACSVLVGSPVDGPPRCTSTIDQRQLQRDRQPDRLRLERDAGTGRGGHPEAAAVGRAERRGDPGDLVLGLEGADAEVLQRRQLVQDVRRRRDRVRPQEQRQPGPLGRRDQPVGERLVAADRAVPARRQRRRLHLVVAPRSPRWSRRTTSRPPARPGSPAGSPACCRTSSPGTAGCPPAAGGTARTAARARTCSSSGRASLRFSPTLRDRLDGQRGQLHRMHLVLGQAAVVDRRLTA